MGPRSDTSASALNALRFGEIAPKPLRGEGEPTSCSAAGKTVDGEPLSREAGSPILAPIAADATGPRSETTGSAMPLRVGETPPKPLPGEGEPLRCSQLATDAMTPAMISRGTCAARSRPACLPEAAVERGERAAKPEIGEPIHHGESGPCDPDVAHSPGSVHSTWQMSLKRISTRRGLERAQRARA